MAIFETFSIKEKICLSLNPNTGLGQTPLFNYIPYNKSGFRLIGESLQIDNLKAVSWIYSLDSVEFPVFELEDTESKQLLTAINLEWNSPRIQLDLILKVGNNDWQKISSYSLLNPSPYPYREYSLGNHALGNNSMLGLAIKDVGFGGLVEQDRVNTYADLTRTITIEKLFLANGIKIANTISPSISIITNSNLNRTGIAFFNNSNVNVFIDSSDTISLASYLVKLEPGDYYEPPTNNYKGNYYGIIESGNASIEIREFI